MAPALHPKRRVQIGVWQGGAWQAVGWAGEFHPKALRNYGIEGVCVGFELNLGALFHAPKPTFKAPAESPRFQLLSRDFAFLLEEATAAAEIQKAVQEHIGEYLASEAKTRLVDVTVFDIYKGTNLPPAKKALTFRVTLAPLEHTLSEKELKVIYDGVVKALESLKGEMRS